MFTDNETRDRLRAIPLPVTLGDIVKAVTGDPIEANLAPTFIRLANIVAGVDLSISPPSNFAKRLWNSLWNH